MDAVKISPVPWFERFSTLQKYGLLLLFYALTRLLVFAAHDYRETYLLQMDAKSYVSTAQYIELHGQISVAHTEAYRQFVGLPLLMIVVDQVVHNLSLAGYLIVTASGLANLFLIQYLFRDWRLTFISSVFLPYALASTCGIWSDPTTLLCFLLAVGAMTKWIELRWLFWLAVFVAGYGLVLRQTAIFLIIPYLLISAVRCKSLGWRGAMGVMLVALLPFAGYLIWCGVTVHQFFPQQREQLDLMNYYVDQMPDPSRYSRRLVDFPLQSYFASIADPSVNHWKKLIVTLVLVLAVVAIGLLIRQSRVTTDPARRTLLLAFAGALGLHVFFHLTIGGTFGFNALDRYIAQANPIVTYALFYGRRLDWKWLALLSIVSVFYAMNLGNGVRSLGFFK